MMKRISIAGLAFLWSASGFAQTVPQCSNWQKGDRTAASCVCDGTERSGDDRELDCGSGATKNVGAAAVRDQDGASPSARIARIEGSAANFGAGVANLPDAPQPQPAAAAAPAFSARPSPKISLQSPRDRKIGNDSYLVSSILFHAAGAFDVTSTVIGIKRDRYESEGDPVYLKIFGEKNARNVGLITGVAVVTHTGAQGISWYLHRAANKQGEAGHRYRQYLLDAAVVAGNGLGTSLHIKEGRTWYHSEGGPL
jgi:hypothetical protein